MMGSLFFKIFYGNLLFAEEGQRKARESEEEVRRMQELLNQLDSKSPIQPAESQAPNRPYGMLQVTNSALVKGA